MERMSGAMMQRSKGFTLIELMIVIAIVGILASLAISAYQTYIVRAQVSEGISLARGAQVPIVDAFTSDGVAPNGRVDAGLSPAPADTQGSYVSHLDILNGRIEIQYGNEAHADIQGDLLYLTPYVSGSTVVWRCGNGAAPVATLMPGAAFKSTTVDPRYLPASCR